MGKITKQAILNKELEPPFMPDLSTFNFDESDLKEKVEQMIPQIEKDLDSKRFETVFN